MDLQLPIEIARDYSSRSQQVRVMSEHWVGAWIFCPNCGSRLRRFENNQPVADFYCKYCSEEYELKAKHGAVGRRILDGAYSTMLERLRASNNPNLFFLTYNRIGFGVRSFFAIPKHFFVPGIIEKRRPLNPAARRAGWTGCNIVLDSIPDLGKIFYVQDGAVAGRNNVLQGWSRTGFVRSTHDVEARGWLLDVLKCVERLEKTDFTLDDIYRSEAHLKLKHPSNNNIQAKIRQQLQVLRDRNILEFAGRGSYRLLSTQA